jgi:dTMP kinase
MLITFEGIDGCGKTTQMQLLKDFLEKNKYQIVTTREPGGTEISEKIRELLLNIKNEINPISELLLFEAARANLIESVILPALKENKIVLSDRFTDSTIVYQGCGRKIDIESIKFLNKIVSLNIKPDITFLLDISLEESLQRRKNLEKDRMEASNSDFLQRIIDGYREIAKAEPERIIVIDAADSKEKTFAKIIEKLKNKLSFKKIN